MKPYTESEPVFSDSIQITEPTDPAHANNINAAPKQLLQNTLVNREAIEELEQGNQTVEFEDYNGEGVEVPEPEEAVNQVASGKADKVFRQYVKASLKGLLNLAQRALSIATGKNQARVFATVADLDAWLAVPENVQQLKVGDNFYIIATEVPDYWWDGRQKQKLETQKVDLTTYDQRIAANASAISELNRNISSHDHDGRYYTETEVNNLLAGKSGTSHLHTWWDITGKPNTFAPSEHHHDDLYYPKITIDNMFSSLIKTKRYTKDNITVHANSVEYFSQSIALTGYTPLGVVTVMFGNASTGGQLSSYILNNGSSVGGNEFYLNMKNLNAGADAKIKIEFVILYVKS